MDSPFYPKPAGEPAFAGQPLQRISAIPDAGHGSIWAMSGVGAHEGDVGLGDPFTFGRNPGLPDDNELIVLRTSRF